MLFCRQHSVPLRGGKEFAPMMTVNDTLCIGCGACVKDCTRQVLELKDGRPIMRGTLCNNCLHCLSICPTGAITCPDSDQDGGEDLRYSRSAPDPDTLMRAFKCRRSIRQFKTTPPEKEKLLRIIEAARFAPSAGNQQNTEFIVIQDSLPDVTAATLRILRNAAEHPDQSPLPVPEQYRERWIRMEENYRERGVDGLFYGAPAVLLVTGPDAISASLAAANAELMSYSLGLGGIYIGFLQFACALAPQETKRILGLRPDEDLVCTLALGYPNVDYVRTPPRRKRDIRFL